MAKYGDRRNAGKKYDKAVAKNLGYKATPGSGCTAHEKADAKGNAGSFLIEAKQYQYEYPFSLKEWDKLEFYAMSQGLIPVFVIRLFPEEVAVMSQQDFSHVTEDSDFDEPFNTVVSKGKKQFTIKRDDLVGRNLHDDAFIPFYIQENKFVIFNFSKFKKIKERYES